MSVDGTIYNGVGYNKRMSYQLKVIQDHPIGFWPLDETSGTTASDISGCGNNGTYTGSLTTNLIPLIPGGTSSSKITTTQYLVLPVSKDYYGSTASGGLADSDTSDNDFTLEAWIHPRFSTNNLTPLLADSTQGIGIFWDKGNIVFKLNTERIDYTVPYTRKSLHLVAVYSVSAMYLYVDGELVVSKDLSLFRFTNSTFQLNIGPTLNSSDSFLIDAPAVYRYSLSPEKIKSHYNEIQPLPAIQISYPEQGELFEFYDNTLSKQYSYAYPANKPWSYFLSDDLYYNKNDDSIELAVSTGSKTVVLDDFLTIPLGFTLDSSKIEWDGDNGVSIQTSLDGTTYTTCTNGGVIPGYSISSFSTDRNLYLRITFTSSDASKYLPKLSNLLLTFYNDLRFYSSTSGSYMSTLEGTSGVSVYDISMSNNNYPILSRDHRNGLRVATNSGFKVNTNSLIKTLEFFYTPVALTVGRLASSASGAGAASEFSWNSSGVISKTNISAIYVNGVSKTSQTNVSGLFEVGELHHVVIVYTSEISGDITFNYTSSGSPSALYQNISIYPGQFDSANALDHYNLYIEKASLVSDDSSFSVTEDGVSIYDNDWTVIKNI
jgi:hypothetical protein